MCSPPTWIQGILRAGPTVEAVAGLLLLDVEAALLECLAVLFPEPASPGPVGRVAIRVLRVDGGCVAVLEALDLIHTASTAKKALRRIEAVVQILAGELRAGKVQLVGVLESGEVFETERAPAV